MKFSVKKSEPSSKGQAESKMDWEIFRKNGALYTKAIKKARRDNWRRFCSEASDPLRNYI